MMSIVTQIIIYEYQKYVDDCYKNKSQTLTWNFNYIVFLFKKFVIQCQEIIHYVFFNWGYLTFGIAM